MYASATNDFQMRTMRGKQHYYKKCIQIRYLNILNILNILTLLRADAKLAILLRVQSLTKVEIRNFPFLHFPRWLCLVNGQVAVSATCRKVGHMSIPMFLFLRYSTMVNFILSSTFRITDSTNLPSPTPRASSSH